MARLNSTCKNTGRLSCRGKNKQTKKRQKLKGANQILDFFHCGRGLLDGVDLNVFAVQNNS